MQSQQIYNKIAVHYYRESTGGFYQHCLEMPAMKQAFKGIKFAGKKVLDVGCGTGRYANWALSLGAQVCGIDPSEAMLKIAQEKNPQGKFVLGSANKLPYKNSSFDFVISGLALEHEKNFDGALKEIKRVLKKNGLLVFSGVNPIMAIAKKVSEGEYSFDRYFNESERLLNLPLFGVKVPFYHRTMETIIKSVIKAGFTIEDYTDAKPIKSCAKKFPERYQKNTNRPFFFVLKLRKQ